MKNFKEIDGNCSGWTADSIREFRSELSVEIENDSKSVKNCYSVSILLFVLSLISFYTAGVVLSSLIFGSISLVAILFCLYKANKIKDGIKFKNVMKSMPNDSFPEEK